ncbi:hypothetical protein B0H13DRAFT_2321740 [Mycena leptocephala]|nr:hypothetical protein B0H13DRAFT_2321740 [Mycena leptocephala]
MTALDSSDEYNDEAIANLIASLDLGDGPLSPATPPPRTPSPNTPAYRASAPRTLPSANLRSHPPPPLQHTTMNPPRGLGTPRNGIATQGVVCASVHTVERATPFPKTKKKAYVVFCGLRCGVVLTWPETRALVQNVRNSIFRGYTSVSDANAAFQYAQARSCSPKSLDPKRSVFVFLPPDRTTYLRKRAELKERPLEEQANAKARARAHQARYRQKNRDYLRLGEAQRRNAVYKVKFGVAAYTSYLRAKLERKRAKQMEKEPYHSADELPTDNEDQLTDDEDQLRDDTAPNIDRLRPGPDSDEDSDDDQDSDAKASGYECDTGAEDSSDSDDTAGNVGDMGDGWHDGRRGHVDAYGHRVDAYDRRVDARNRRVDVDGRHLS